MKPITPETKLNEVLEIDEKLIEIIRKNAPKFSSLKNQIVTNLLASRITIRQVCRMGKGDLSNLVSELNKAIGMQNSGETTTNTLEGVRGTWGNWEKSKYETFDVRSYFNSGEEPFTDIMEKIDLIPSDEGLAIIVPFEPFPLYTVLEDRGWAYRVKRVQEDYFILFRRASGDQTPVKSIKEVSDDYGVEEKDGVHYIDVRYLEPPEPMARILNLMASLPAGEIIKSRHERRPVIFLNKLEQVGASFQIKEIDENNVELTITIPQNK